MIAIYAWRDWASSFSDGLSSIPLEASRESFRRARNGQTECPLHPRPDLGSRPSTAWSVRDTDSPLEETGFKLSVPRRAGIPIDHAGCHPAVGSIERYAGDAAA